MKKFSIKKGDQVRVIAGSSKGTQGEVLKVLPKKDVLVVKGCNVVRKAIKPTEENKKGGFEAREMPIHISNVVKVES